jgi:hypothetical protein
MYVRVLAYLRKFLLGLCANSTLAHIDYLCVCVYGRSIEGVDATHTDADQEEEHAQTPPGTMDVDEY